MGWPASGQLAGVPGPASTPAAGLPGGTMPEALGGRPPSGDHNGGTVFLSSSSIRSGGISQAARLAAARVQSNETALVRPGRENAMEGPPCWGDGALKAPPV